MTNSYNHASTSVYDTMSNVICTSPEYNPQAIVDYYQCGNQAGRCSNPRIKRLIMKAKNHLSAIGWTFFYEFKKTGSKEFKYRAPTGKLYVSLKSACECVLKNLDPSSYSKKHKKIQAYKQPKKESESFSCVDRPQDYENLCFDQKSDKDSGVLESQVKKERFSCKDVKGLPLTRKKVTRKDEVSNTKNRGILGSLIENNIVERGARVSYINKKNGGVMKRGRVYEDGIMCDCCNEMFLLTKFEEHAGSTNHRPAANIFFKDNRSILDCQTRLQLKSTASTCGLCHKGESSNSTSDEEGDSKVHDLLKCVQCKRHFHHSCINKLGFVICVDDPWLCTDRCERVYLGRCRSYGIKVET